MNLRQVFSQKINKNQVVFLAGKIRNSPIRFKELMELALCDDHKISMRASWTAIHTFEQNHQIITPWIGKMVKFIGSTDNGSSKRNLIRILEETAIPKKYQGEMFDSGIKILQSPHDPIAAKAFVMTVLSNIVKQNLELKRELILVISELLKNDSGPGIQNRGKKTIKELNRI